MGLNFRVTSNKFRTAFHNTNTFTINPSDNSPNLTACLMDYVQAEFVVEVGWDSLANSFNTWFFTARTNPNEYEISRASGSFITDGWSVGNTFDFLGSVSTVPVLLASGCTVDFLSDDGTLMFATITGGPYAGAFIDHQIRARANSSANYLNSIIFQPNLVENSTAYSNAWLQNGASIGYYSSNARSLTPVPMSVLGVNQSFVTGAVEINYAGDVGSYYQSFKIVDSFLVTPYFQEGDDLITTPDFLAGVNSLKYVWRAEFRNNLSNPNTSKTITFENNLGSVGFFNETITGGVPVYTLDDVSYANIYDALTLETETIVTFKVDGVFDANTKYTVYFSYLPTSEEYSTNDPFEDVFRYKYQSNFLNVTSTYPGQVINALDSSVILGQLVINATVDVTALGFNTSQRYLIALEVGNVVLTTNQTSDRVVFMASQRDFATIASNNDLIVMDSITFDDYSGDNGESLTVYPEDGLAVNFAFRLDRAKEAVLTSLAMDLVAHNPIEGKWFSLDSFVFNISTQVTGGVQPLNINGVRGYLMSNPTIFNLVDLQYINLAGDFAFYEGVLAQKINWLSWKFNPNVDTVFYDTMKPNNNLNYLTSNYTTDDYEIKVLFRATVTGLNQFGDASVQEYELFSDPLTVFAYLVDGNDPVKIVPTVETFNSLSNANLDGDLSPEADTLFRITWDLIDPISSTTGSSVTHRIELSSQQGITIFELTDGLAEVNSPNNILKPLDGETGVKTYILGGNLVSECLIDYTRLIGTSEYNLSGKVTKI